MARPQKDGLDYFPFDTDFFYDNGIKIIQGKYGMKIVYLYVYLLCKIYKEKGYYMPYDEDINFIISSELGLDSDEVKKLIDFLAEKNLFDKNMLKKENIITSKSVQKRYQFAIRSRSLGRQVLVQEKYWLLEDFEGDKILGFSEEKTPKEKKIKEKINKNKLYNKAKTNAFQDYDTEITDFDIELIHRRLNKEGDSNEDSNMSKVQQGV